MQSEALHDRRALYTHYDAKELAGNETCRGIFLRGVAWAVKKGSFGRVSSRVRPRGHRVPLFSRRPSAG